MANKVSVHQDHQGLARITNLPKPMSPGEPVTVASQTDSFNTLAQKQPVRVAATTNVLISTPDATIDGIVLAPGDRILLTNQTNPVENGIYIYGVSLTRAPDFIDASTVIPSSTVTVAEGFTNEHTAWQLATDSPIVVGSTPLTFIWLQKPPYAEEVPVLDYRHLLAGATNVEDSLANIALGLAGYTRVTLASGSATMVDQLLLSDAVDVVWSLVLENAPVRERWSISACQNGAAADWTTNGRGPDNGHGILVDINAGRIRLLVTANGSGWRAWVRRDDVIPAV